MGVGWRCYWWCMAGFCMGATLANVSPGSPDWGPLRVGVMLAVLAVPTLGHWLLSRYRIVVARRDVQAGQEDNR